MRFALIPMATLLALGGGASAQEQARPTATAPSPLRPEPGRFAAAPPALQARIREDPFVYFRFLNTAWSTRVCDAFRAEMPTLPTAILQGDAHLEQYALTATARGLDDFDDAARGPSVIDIVRFLGSTDLVARQRGWSAEIDRLFDRFFAGYERAVEDPAYLPPDPAVVTRLRARTRPTREQYLAWGDSLMQEPTARQRENVIRSLRLVEEFVREVQPGTPAGYFDPKRVGWLHLGVGSALAHKVLIRMEGPSPDSDDDLFLEAKELSRLDSVPCLQVPPSAEAFRVIAAAEQIGRLQNSVLVVAPRREDQGPEVRDWWVRTWDPTYAEVATADLASADELAEVVHDAGVQLGASNLLQPGHILETQLRRAELAAVRRLEPRIRATARELTDDLLAGWEELRDAD